jgi:mono/diheme cytochrome c family protein
MTLRIWPVLVMLCTLTAQAADEAAIQRGREVYTLNQCYACHGTMGQGGERGAGPRIAPNPFPYAAFEQQMRKPRAVMPRYNPQAINAEQLKDLHAFVASIPASPPVANIPLLRDAMR